MTKTLRFPSVEVRTRTKESPLTPTLATVSPQITYNVLTSENVLEVRLKSVKSDTTQGQPEGQYALPDFSQVTVNTIINSTYFKLSKITSAGVIDTTASIALKVLSVADTGLNAAGQPVTSWADVVRKLTLQPVRPDNFELLTLASSQDYWFDVVPELPYIWYPSLVASNA